MGENTAQENLADDSIEVRVLGLDGGIKCTVAAKLDWKIAQVKKEIGNAEGIPAAELKLIYGERNLFNDVVLGTIWGGSTQVEVALMRIEKEAATKDSAATKIQSMRRARAAREAAAKEREARTEEARTEPEDKSGA